MASDRESTPPLPATPNTPNQAVNFTEREERILKVAWFCLKSGAPDIDVQKLTRLGEFKTAKTASNTWGVIKKKLNVMAPEDPEGDGNGTGDGEAPVISRPKRTPTKTPGRKKPSKRAKQAAADQDDEMEEASPAKKAKKSPVKKGSKKAAVKGEAENGGKDDVKVKEEKSEEEMTFI
ncbi:hypothetical protein K431DRAFT_295910 [Polychaeton citri CBS 116435]|uniref:Uncharacterized protein n=1 Tax=Polychaeton citri CBS 116435 TaxID=1314669 RepID=A0A9P4UP39_9PEZI|nr:hypothetical protein K431DRAFT_295910 [Polychaeton citri CBS 116435]